MLLPNKCTAARTGGLFGERGRIPTHSVTDALVMGRAAGRSAAAMK